MTRAVAVLAVVGTLALASVLPGTATFDLHARSVLTNQIASAQRIGTIDELVTEAMRANAVPGVAVAVVRGDTIVHLRGYGTADGDPPVTPRTRFLVASLSKSFTAVALLRLVDDGAVDLDAPVRRYLPTFHTAGIANGSEPAASGPITVRQVLNQTSGMADTAFPAPRPPQATSIAQRVRSLREAGQVVEPGSEFHYFNPHYAVAARIVEVVSGRPFGEFLDERVLTPLRMDDTTSVVTTAGLADLRQSRLGLAQGHLVAFGQAIADDEPSGYLAGSAGVVTTAADLANFLRMNLAHGTFAGTRVLERDTVATMHTPPEKVPDDYAMGWFARDTGAGRVRLEHTGVLSTFYAEQVIVPGPGSDGGYGVAVLANAQHTLSGVQGLANRIATSLDSEQDGGGPDGPGIGLRAIGYTVATLTGLTLVLRSWRLLRVHAWRPKSRTRPRGAARVVTGILRTLWTVWMLAPVAVLAALPAVTTAFTGRVFGYGQLARAMPDVVIWLGTAALTGLALTVTRGLVLLRDARASRAIHDR